MPHVPNNGVLSSARLAALSLFDRRSISRKAEKGDIPDARPTPTRCQWEFPVTHRLSAWICFYQVRHTLLRKRPKSPREREILKAWGTDWRYALKAFDFAKLFPSGGVVESPDGQNLPLGPNTTWKAVEALAYIGCFPRDDWKP